MLVLLFLLFLLLQQKQGWRLQRSVNTGGLPASMTPPPPLYSAGRQFCKSVCLNILAVNGANKVFVVFELRRRLEPVAGHRPPAQGAAWWSDSICGVTFVRLWAKRLDSRGSVPTTPPTGVFIGRLKESSYLALLDSRFLVSCGPRFVSRCSSTRKSLLRRHCHP